jgi:thiosulfate/3-mercaptopyruvate sulfurtransferase
MKRPIYFFGVLIIVLLSVTAFNKKQTEPWTPDQLMHPETLAAIINDSTAAQPLIINMGPVNSIKGAIKIGPAKEKENLNELKKLLLKENKNRAIVIYCGCCPFKDCPNIRPAFSLLTEMKFTNHKLLNLPHNLKVDWINYGYPMSN